MNVYMCVRTCVKNLQFQKKGAANKYVQLLNVDYLFTYMYHSLWCVGPIDEMTSKNASSYMVFKRSFTDPQKLLKATQCQYSLKMI